MRARLIHIVLLIFASWLGAGPAQAAGRRVVVETIGLKSYGRSLIHRSLRREMAGAGLALVPSQKLERAKETLKVEAGANPTTLGRLARYVGADHLVSVKLVKRRLGYAAKVRLVDAVTGRVELEVVESYEEPRRDAGAIASRIAERVLAQLEGRRPRLAQVEPPTSVEEERPAKKEKSRATKKKKKGRKKKARRARAVHKEEIDRPEKPLLVAPWAGAPQYDPAVEGGVPDSSREDRVVAPQVPIVLVTPDPPEPWLAASEPPAPAEEVASGRWYSAEGPVGDAPQVAPSRAPAASVEAPAPARERPEVVRLAVGAGAGWVRSYSLRSDRVGQSELSYRLAPISMFTGALRLSVPATALGLELQGSFRPVTYSIATGDGTSTPSGSILDLAAALTFRFEVGDVQLAPRLGARVTRAGLERHPSDILPSTTTVVGFGGLGVEVPLSESFELSGLAQVGGVLAYSESPVNSGDLGGGFSLGLGASLTWWITKRFGLLIDSRFSVDLLSFSNAPSRPLPPGEEGVLTDVSIAVVDLTSSAGAVVRF